MNIRLITAAAMATAFCAQGAFTVPDAGKFYRVRHVSGLYLTDGGFHSIIADKAEDNTQILRFIPVEGQEGVYNVQRASSKMLIGTDRKWSTTAISRDIPQARFRIKEASDPNYIVLENVVMNAQNSSKACLGSDNTTSGSEIYTDKSGTDAQKHYWVLEEAQKYAEADPLPDVYPDNNLPDSDTRKNAYDGYKLVFAEEFSQDGAPDHDIWTFEEGFKRNNEDQYYNGDKNSYIRDGVLVIEGKYVLDEKIPNPRYSRRDSTWPSSIGEYLTWTSGSMQTRGGWNDGYTWQYGIYEVRAKVPQYVGSWPAIWSTGKSHEWPYGGEIDIMEYYGHCIHGNVCWGNGSRWGATWNSATVHDNDLGEGWGDDFHIWRMVWDYDHMELWCDDWLVNNIDLDDTVNKVPGDSFDHGNGCNPFRDVRHMLWLNLALGGINGGSLADTPRPLYYQIDYARVYQKIGTDGKAKYHVDETVSEPTFPFKDGETDPAGVSNIRTDNDAAVIAVYNTQGIRVADTMDDVNAHGIYIVRTTGGSFKMQK